jgi:hypothetical protein
MASSVQNRLTKTQYVAAIEANIREAKADIDTLREMSASRTLGERELEDAFACLYDVLDLLEHYKKSMKVTDDEFTRSNSSWLRLYMSDLILYGVGAMADIRTRYDTELQSKTGNKIGGMVVEVRMLPYDRQTPDVPLYNWNQVDKFFWDRNYEDELDAHYYDGRLPYDETTITYGQSPRVTRSLSRTGSR